MIPVLFFASAMMVLSWVWNILVLEACSTSPHIVPLHSAYPSVALAVAIAYLTSDTYRFRRIIAEGVKERLSKQSDLGNADVEALTHNRKYLSLILISNNKESRHWDAAKVQGFTDLEKGGGLKPWIAQYKDNFYNRQDRNWITWLGIACGVALLIAHAMHLFPLLGTVYCHVKFYLNLIIFALSLWLGVHIYRFARRGQKLVRGLDEWYSEQEKSALDSLKAAAAQVPLPEASPSTSGNNG